MSFKTSGIIEEFSLGDVISATESPYGDEVSNSSNNGGAGGEGNAQQSNSLLPIVKSNSQTVLTQLFEEEYKSITLDKASAIRIAKSVNSLRRGGSAGQRLICAGENCDFNSACELFKTKLGPAVQVKDPQTGHINLQQDTAAPVGKICPLEEVVVQDARARYMLEFEDLSEDGLKVIEGYINDLCQIEMMSWRCGMVMSFDYANPLIQTPGAVTSDGRVIWKKEANPILEIQERLQQRKTRILVELTKTPREKYKKESAVGISGDDSLGRSQAAKKAALRESSKSLPQEMEVPDHVRDTSLLGKKK